MVKRDRRAGSSPGIPAEYEGPEVLDALLSRAGCPLGTADVEERFREAIAAGLERSDAVPALFEEEPRFGSPDEARRLYANLFGLWSRVRSGGGKGAETPAPVRGQEEAAQSVPERGSTTGREVPRDVVEIVWRHLDALPERDRRRARHRFETAQPDLAAWVDALPLPDVGAVAASDLVFECWAMLDTAFGDRLGPASWSDIRELASEPPPLEHEQRALASYVAEVLDLVAAEEPGFGPPERAQVERAMATAIAAMDRALGD
ncbi:MAG TPA: hypothetical protein VFK85_06115 [Anaeromyxobacteraceae bacterium]|nr:hypothetical protein [Anaeromyxobacteraceae bacterium]